MFFKVGGEDISLGGKVTSLGGKVVPWWASWLVTKLPGGEMTGNL